SGNKVDAALAPQAFPKRGGGVHAGGCGWGHDFGCCAHKNLLSKVKTHSEATAEKARTMVRLVSNCRATHDALENEQLSSHVGFECRPFRQKSECRPPLRHLSKWSTLAPVRRNKLFHFNLKAHGPQIAISPVASFIRSQTLT